MSNRLGGRSDVLRAIGVPLVATDVIEDVGAELRSLREKAGVSQRKVAFDVGTSQAQIIRIEHGQTMGVSLRAIVEVADALGYSTEVVFTPYED